MEPIQLLGDVPTLQSPQRIERQAQQRFGRQAHHHQRLVKRHMGVSATEHHRIATAGKAPATASGDKGHQVAEAAP